MKGFRKRTYLVVALLCSLVVTIVIASLLLAKRDASVYPGNLYAGPIYLGNLTQSGALHKLQDDSTAASLAVDCIIGQDVYTLQLKDLGIKLDAQATINKIDSYIGEWSLLGHSLNRGKKQVVPPVWEYDYDRLRQSLNNLAVSRYQEPVDARVVLVGNYLLHQPEQNGWQIVPDKAGEVLITALNEGQFTVVLPVKTISPAITRSQIDNIEELLSVQAVPVGSRFQEVSEAAWAVPGRIIMPGESVPINLMIDAGAPEGQEMVVKWQEAMSLAAEEAGLVYKAAGQELINTTGQPVALLITREKDLGLIRIYGQQRNTDFRITISRTYRPLISSPAGEQEEGPSGVKLYRHKFTNGQLQDTGQLGSSAAAVFDTTTSSAGVIPNNYK